MPVHVATLDGVLDETYHDRHTASAHELFVQVTRVPLPRPVHDAVRELPEGAYTREEFERYLYDRVGDAAPIGEARSSWPREMRRPPSHSRR